MLALSRAIQFGFDVKNQPRAIRLSMMCVEVTRTICFYYYPHVYNTQSGVPPREAPFRAIDLGGVALRPHPT